MNTLLKLQYITNILYQYLYICRNDRLIANSSEEYEQISQQFVEDLKQKLVTWGNHSFLKFNIPEICEVITQTSAAELYTHLFNGLKREFDIIKDIMPQNGYLG